MDKYNPSENIESISDTLVETCRSLVEAVPGIRTNSWRNFDEYTRGFRDREFSIICGSTGAGKTTLLSNMSWHYLNLGVPHFVMSVENGRIDFMRRLISIEMNEDWNTGDPIPKEKVAEFYRKFGPKYLGAKLIFSKYENRISVENILADLEHAHKNHGAKIAFMDNLNFFLEVTSATQQVIEMDRVIHELIMFCKRTDIHLVLIMHPKKTENTRVLSEFDIKGSSTAVQEAHNVFLFNRFSPEDIKALPDLQNCRELTISKMRRLGKYTGKRIIFDGSKPRYTEVGDK